MRILAHGPIDPVWTNTPAIEKPPPMLFARRTAGIVVFESHSVRSRRQAFTSCPRQGGEATRIRSARRYGPRVPGRRAANLVALPSRTRAPVPHRVDASGPVRGTSAGTPPPSWIEGPFDGRANGRVNFMFAPRKPKGQGAQAVVAVSSVRYSPAGTFKPADRGASDSVMVAALSKVKNEAIVPWCFPIPRHYGYHRHNRTHQMLSSKRPSHETAILTETFY